MKTRSLPIVWSAEVLECECGEDMSFLFKVRKSDTHTIFLHTCTTCGRTEEMDKQYPAPVWKLAHVTGQ